MKKKILHYLKEYLVLLVPLYVIYIIPLIYGYINGSDYDLSLKNGLLFVFFIIGLFVFFIFLLYKILFCSILKLQISIINLLTTSATISIIYLIVTQLFSIKNGAFDLSYFILSYLTIFFVYLLKDQKLNK